MFTIIAALMHPAVLLTLPFIVLSKFRVRIGSFFVVMAAPICFRFTALWLREWDIKYFQFIGNSYLKFTSEGQYRSGRSVLYGAILVIIIIVIAYFQNFSRVQRLDVFEKKRHIFNFIGLYSCYILGNIGNYDMVLRPAYILGVLSPILSEILCKNCGSKLKFSGKAGRNIIIDAEMVAVLLLSIYVNTTFIIYYGSYFRIN